MMLVSLISYVDRNTLALLAPTILKETGLSAEQYGFIIAAFSVTYTIGNPVWGRLLDRIGLRVGMTLAVTFWTLASVAHAWASGFWSFALARATLGFGEGATFPGGLRAVTQTLPVQQQSRGIALSYSGGSLGALLTPLIVTPIFLWWGWRAAFFFTGFIGAAWVALWLLISRRPDVRERPEQEGSRGQAPPLRFRDRALWGFILGYAGGALPLGFVLYGSSIYLNRSLGLSQELIGKLLWIPPLGWEIGYFLWGWVMDRMLAAGVPRYVAARRLMFVAMWLSLPLAAVPLMPWLWLVMAEMFLALFVTVGFVIPTVSYAMHLYTPANSGLIAGVGAGSYGGIVALLMPLFGRFFDQHRWEASFLVAALVPPLGYFAWVLLNRRERAGG